MRELGPPLQDILLTALGIDAQDDEQVISWDQFVRLNTITFLQCARFEDMVEYYARILDPTGLGLVPERQLNRTMNIFFGGAFQSDMDKDSDSGADSPELQKHASSPKLSSPVKQPSVASLNPTSKFIQGTKGYATDIKRILVAEGCITNKGELDTAYFKKQLLNH